jgi:hypothetical protein
MRHLALLAVLFSVALFGLAGCSGDKGAGATKTEDPRKQGWIPTLNKGK